jgi:hypothetical protein
VRTVISETGVVAPSKEITPVLSAYTASSALYTPPWKVRLQPEVSRNALSLNECTNVFGQVGGPVVLDGNSHQLVLFAGDAKGGGLGGGLGGGGEGGKIV